MSSVIILRGIPGAGKSTYANTLARGVEGTFDGIRVFSADKFFVGPDGTYAFDQAKLGLAHASCLRGYVTALNSDSIHDSELLFIVDNTNTSTVEIAPYYALANAYGLPCEIHTLKTPIEVAAARCIHGVPPEKVARMAVALDIGTEQMPPYWKHKEVYQ